MRIRVFSPSAFAALLVILLFVGWVSAQSRRRAPATEPPLPPVPSAPADPEPTTTSSNKTTAPAIPLIVGVNSFTASFDSLPSSFNDYLYGACVNRLRDSGAVAVTASGDMTRKEAIDRAKAQTETYVVWMEAEVDSLGQSRSNRGDSFFVNYVIFSPQTAKVKASGRVYADTVRAATTGPVGISLPTIGRRLPIQYRLQLIGAEVADRVLSQFSIPLRKG